jgi:uncharacterized protein (DUF3084 family)
MKISQSLWYNTQVTMSSDDKILKALEDLKEGQKALNSKVDTLEHGQKALQADVTAMKGEVEKIPAIEKQLEQQGKILNAVMANTATLLEEHSAQRMDIRSLHTDMQSLHAEVHASKEEVKAEIRAARADAVAPHQTVVR